MIVPVLRQSLIAAFLLAGSPAFAQEVPVPIRTEGFVFVAPDAPTVLESSPGGQPLAPVSRPDLNRPAAPVAQVMNGGGFGYTGFDYFNDEISEGRLGARKRPKEYVVAPSYEAPPRR